MAKSKTQVLKALKATPKYKKATPARKQALRKAAVASWSKAQPQNWNAADMGGGYGYSRAMLEATPELLDIFRKAHIKEWSKEKIVAAIENTGWYRNNSVRWKEVEQVRLKNPGEFNKSVDRAKYNIRVMAGQVGADITEAELNKLASDSVYGAWDEGDLRRYVSAEIDISNTGGLFGDAGKAEMELRKMAAENGVEYNNEWFRTNARKAIESNSIGDVERQIREDSANTYTQWGDGIRNGTTTVAKAAGSYMRALEKTYDMEDGTASVFDPHVKRAITDRDEQGNPVTKPLWKFEEDLRRDPKWLTTKNGAETMANVSGGLLQEWGFLKNG